MFVYRNYYNCRFLRITGKKALLSISDPQYALPLILYFFIFKTLYLIFRILFFLSSLTSLFVFYSLCLPTVDIKSDVPLAVEPLSPLDLRTDLRMLGPGSDPGLWERQLQQELLLIQKQQQIQKQLLISEFQKQHEKLTRQHQAQLQEHLKVGIALNSWRTAQHRRAQRSMA